MYRLRLSHCADCCLIMVVIATGFPHLLLSNARDVFTVNQRSAVSCKRKLFLRWVCFCQLSFSSMDEQQNLNPPSQPGLWIRNSSFRLRLQHLKVLHYGSKMILSIENGKPLNYLYNPLAPQTRAVEPESNFWLRLRLHDLKIFRSGGSSHPKLLGLRLWAQAPQPWVVNRREAVVIDSSTVGKRFLKITRFYAFWLEENIQFGTREELLSIRDRSAIMLSEAPP